MPVRCAGITEEGCNSVDRLLNPYRPGAGTAPALLVGRDALVDEFGVALRRTIARQPGKSCMPLGLRGVGKTVLLNRFLQIAADEGVRTAFIEATDSGSFASQIAIRLRRVLLELATSPVRRAVTRALGALRAFALQLPDGTSISVGVDATPGLADSGLLDEDLADLLVTAGEAAAECGTGIVLAIDEAQYLDAQEMGAVIGAIHRASQLDLPVLLVAAGLAAVARPRGERTHLHRAALHLSRDRCARRSTMHAPR